MGANLFNLYESHLRENEGKDLSKGKSSMYIGAISTVLVQKVIQEKLKNIYKTFELYQFFMHNFLCQKCPDILITRRIDTFCCSGVDAFWSRSISTVSAEKSYNKNQQYCLKLCQYFYYTYYPKYSLADLTLCYYLPPTHLPLAYLLFELP